MRESSKVRFDGLDVTAMVAFVQTIVGRRIVNVYDGDSGESYLFKLDGQKEFLLLESGIRFHTIASFDSNGMPSPFCSKLRKHLRGLRLELVRQIGTDRVVLFQFGAGSSKHSIILELYSKGNLVLTDGDYRILALLRSHEYQDSVRVQVGQVYPITYASTSTATDDAASNHGGDTENDGSFFNLTADEIRKLVEEQIAASANKPKKKKTVVTLKSFLLQPFLKVFQYGPALIEHCILHAELDPNKPLEGMTVSDEEWQHLQSSMKEQGPLHMDKLQTAKDSPGFILYSASQKESLRDKDATGAAEELAHGGKLLLSFQPHLLLQHKEMPHAQYDTFGSAVADFFFHLDGQRRLQKIQNSETAVRNKLAKVQQDQADRLQQLESDQERLMNEAEVVKTNATIVDQALQVINSALDSGMDWNQLEELVKMEQAGGNPVAAIIRKLSLDDDSMVLKLRMDSSDDKSEYFNVTVLLKESAHANASRLFGKYRASKDKSLKTVEASSKALQAAEESAQRQLTQSQNKTKQVFQKRKAAWYEKFLWFVTSDNYLVLGGRDAHQNETLVKRYLRPGDAYLHADVHGAASCVLRAKRRRLPDGSTQTVPLADQALVEAGNFTICRSSAWASRMVTSAWWVESHQVSKTAPSGEYLSVGSFMIRGKKNFLPPTQLEMGLAVLFRLGDDDSIARHQKERRDFALMQLESEDFAGPTRAADASTNRVATNEEISQDDETALSVNEENGTSPLVSEVEGQVPDALPTESSQQGPVVQPEKSDFDSAQNRGVGEEEAPVTGDNQPPKREKRGLSVRDRKLIKKYGSLEEAERVLENRALHGTDRLKTEEKDKAKSINNEDERKTKRGKKGKAKKMKKYADQDDEDREFAMLALQGGEKHKKKNKSCQTESVSAAQNKVAEDTVAVLVKDTSKTADRLPEQVKTLLAEVVTIKGNGETSNNEVRWEKLDAETIEQLLQLEPKAQEAAAQRLLSLKQSTRVDNFSASLSGIIRTIHKYGYENLNKQQNDEDTSKRKTKLQKDADQQKWQETLQKEGIVAGEDLDEDAVDDTIELSKLTGKPHADDLLLYATPVCAPYQTLSQYTYKVKLTPGNMKRGKAAKQCIDIFLKMDGSKATKATDRNRDLVKRLGDNDWVQVICADVKISSAGASKANKKQKASKKKSKK